MSGTALSMLPTVELEALSRARANAAELAAAGELARGYTCLLFGLHLAKRARAAGKPWAPDLIQRYRDEMDAYTANYGVRVE